MGYGRMIYQTLDNLVRQVDLICTWNKEKLQQELAQKKREDRKVDLGC